MLLHWLNATHLDRGEQAVLRTTFTTARPYPHLLLNGFLLEHQAKKLAQALKKEIFEEKDSDLFQFRQTQDLNYSRAKPIKEFAEFLNSKAFMEFMSSISGLALNVGSSDLFGSLYQDTDYLLCHDDQLEKRKIAYILYLSEEFNEIEGGALTLLGSDARGNPGEVVQRYYPGWNKLIFFAVSKKSWHAVEEVLSAEKKRYAIGGWLH